MHTSTSFSLQYISNENAPVGVAVSRRTSRPRFCTMLSAAVGRAINFVAVLVVGRKAWVHDKAAKRLMMNAAVAAVGRIIILMLMVPFCFLWKVMRWNFDGRRSSASAPFTNFYAPTL